MKPGSAAIIGAGIGGLTAGLCLRQRGWQVTVHEQAPALTEVGAGLQIGPNGLKVLTALGLDAALAPALSHPEQIDLADGRSGQLVASVAMGATARGRYGAGYAQLHRADLIAGLAEALMAAGGAVELGSRIDSAAVPGADLVIGADGVRGQTRSLIGSDAPPVFTGHVAWRALVPRLPTDPAPDRTRVYLGAGRHVVVYALRGGTVWNIVAVEERSTWTPEGWSTAADPADLRRAFAGWAPDLAGLLARIDGGLLWGLFAHPELPRWWADTPTGPVVLLGDACHPMLPYLAQGAVMAIEDAWVLGASLDAAPDVYSALKSYEISRKPRASRVQRTARRNGRIYHLPPGPTRLIVRGGMAAMARLPGGLLRSLDWLYGAEVAERPLTPDA